MSKNEKSEPSLELIAARFAYVGAVVTTLGDILATISAGISLKILEQDLEEGNPSTSPPEEEIQQMQEQIDYLIRELRYIKKIIK